MTKKAGPALQISNFINEHKINFQRGESYDYFVNITRLNTNIALPILSQDSLLEATVKKNYYVLWNILIDDSIDRDSNVDYLNIINSFHNPDLPNSIINTILDIPSKSSLLKQWLYFDLMEIVNAFRYEFIINQNPKIATIKGYDKYSTMTASLLLHLDIDLLLSEVNFTEGEVNILRRSFQHFSKAIKYSSDVGSIKREFDIEKNLNFIIIMAIKAGRLSLKDFYETEFSEMKDNLNAFIHKTRNLAIEHLSKGCKLIETIKTIDSEILTKSISEVVSNYNNNIDIYFKE